MTNYLSLYKNHIVPKDNISVILSFDSPLVKRIFSKERDRNPWCLDLSGNSQKRSLIILKDEKLIATSDEPDSLKRQLDS